MALHRSGCPVIFQTSKLKVRQFRSRQMKEKIVLFLHRADRGCVCCKLMVRYDISSHKSEVSINLVVFYKDDEGIRLVDKVIHFINTPSTCCHHSVVYMILNFCNWVLIVIQFFTQFQY